MKYEYYIHWSNFEIDGPFDSFIEAVKMVINEEDGWSFNKKGWEKFPPEEFRGETSKAIDDEEVVYSYNELGIVGFDITRKEI